VAAAARAAAGPVPSVDNSTPRWIEDSRRSGRLHLNEMFGGVELELVAYNAGPGFAQR
jgi:hypothetical protein